MPLVFRYSGGVSNSDPDSALGGAMSNTELNAVAMNNLFDNITFSEAISGDEEYRCLVLFAEGNSYSDVSIYMSSETSSAYTQLDMAVEGTNISSPNYTTIPDEDTAPDQSGWTETNFVHRNSGSKLVIGNMDTNDRIHLWFKRIVSINAESTSSDSGVISVEYIQIT